MVFILFFDAMILLILKMFIHIAQRKNLEAIVPLVMISSLESN